MDIIGAEKLDEFAQRHPNARSALNRWFRLIDEGTFRKVIKLDPNDIAAYNNRGVAKNYLHDYQSAIADFDKVIELDPSKALVYYNNGVVKNQIANYQSAITDFDKAIELGFNSVEVYYHRASAKVHLDKYNAALSDYDKVIELKPDFVEAYNIRGILRSELGRHDEALADYTEAIRIKPDYAEAYAYRGVLKAHLGRINTASSDFQKALELPKCSGNNNLKAFVENQLQQLNREASKHNNKEPRRGRQMQTHIVTRVIDGDTLEVSPEISRRAALQTPMERLIGAPLPAETPTERLSRPHTFHKIRLRNIDTPEIGTPQGEKAIRYLKQLLEGKRVTFKPAGISYDRVVADVWRYPDHVFVNAIMVYSGHAKWSHPPR